MSDFLQLAQSLAVAMKALQMYTARHPRAQESLATTHAKLEGLLADKERIQFVVTGLKAFVDGQVQDPKSPHINMLVKLVSERGVSGFVFERGVEVEEVLAFLQGLTLKPPKLDEPALWMVKDTPPSWVLPGWLRRNVKKVPKPLLGASTMWLDVNALPA